MIRKSNVSLEDWTVISTSRDRNYLLLAKPREKEKGFYTQ